MSESSVRELALAWRDLSPQASVERSELEPLLDLVLRETEFPARTLEEALRAFRRPFSAHAVKWKIEAASEKWALVVPYIDARLVIERLNKVWPWWRDSYTEAREGLWCELELFPPDGPAIARPGVGKGRDLKAAESDALKRAAVKWGIGVSIYAVPRVDVNQGQESGAGFKWRQTRDNKYAVDILEPGRKKLAAFYEAWLGKYGVDRFGEVLDHGDVEDTLGDPAEVAASDADDSAGTAPALPPLLGAEADAMRQEIRAAYKDAIVPKPALRKKLPPARMQQRIEEASVSGKQEQLVALRDEILELGKGEASDG